ncbi:MAG TPA: hypothetical protein VHH34_26265 [Pseudonocardiaceae bacterium]|nr:hypothetical protein [Pseudonocardiaceae bacterium]
MPSNVHAIATQMGDDYWAGDNAAEPVLLLGQAVDAITEALHQLRSGTRLDNQDLAAAGVALGDLFGGLGELADLLHSSVRCYADAAPLQVAQLREVLGALRSTVAKAKQAAERVQFSGAAIPSPRPPS